MKQRFQDMTSSMVKFMFDIMTKQQEKAYITRFAVTFLSVWQVIILVGHNYWIPQLVDISTPIYYYIVFISILAAISVFSLILYDSLLLALFVLGVNSFTYLVLGLEGLWESPPRASSGFSIFVMLISIAGFWRIYLLYLRDRTIHTE